MSKRNVGSGSKDDLISSYSELVEITDGMRSSAYEIIVANAKVVKELPNILGQLEENKTDKENVDKLVSVAKTIAKDTDSFIKELNLVDDRFTSIKAKGVKSAKVASKNYTNVLTISTKYHDITERLSTTTSELVNDFTDMCIDFGIVNEDGEEISNVKETKE